MSEIADLIKEEMKIQEKQLRDMKFLYPQLKNHKSFRERLELTYGMYDAHCKALGKPNIYTGFMLKDFYHDQNPYY